MRTKLLSEQEMEDLIEFREHIIARAISTERCDRQKAEEALRKIYEFLGMIMPKEVVWVDSPHQMHMLGLENDLEWQLWRLLNDQMHQSSIQIEEKLYYKIYKQIWEQLGEKLFERLIDNFGDIIRAEVGDFDDKEVPRRPWEEFGAKIHDQLWCEIDNWAAQYEIWICFAAKFLDDRVDKNFMDLPELVYELGEHIFLVLPCEDKIIFCDRPTRIYHNENKRLHSLDSIPAIEFADGWRVYAWDGVRVDKKIVTVPPKREDLMVDKFEIRRILWERWGRNYCIQQLDLEHVSSDGWGELWQCDTGSSELTKFVKVMNTTPEPDGHFKDYWLRVPSDITTAKSGIAWTFGLESGEHVPSIMR